MTKRYDKQDFDIVTFSKYCKVFVHIFVEYISLKTLFNFHIKLEDDLVINF